MAGADLHFHILPALDDGPQTMEESLELARQAAEDGTSDIAATPHVRPEHPYDVAELAGRVRALQERIDADGIGVRIHPGGELGHMMVGRLRQSELEQIALGPAGARWVLLEAPFAGLDDEVHAAADELRDRGFGILLAHPERAAGVLDDGASRLRRELDRGARLQVNAWSLLSGHGSAAERVSVELVRAGLASVLASDAHGGWRTPALSGGRDAARALGLSPAAASDLVEGAPSRLLARGLQPGPPSAAVRRLAA